MLGGSAVYFSYAASYFTPVRLVGAVGEDWPAEYTGLLQQRQIDTAGLRVVPGGKTFRWRGRYARNMNDRETLEVQLNVMAEASSRCCPSPSPLPVPVPGQRLAADAVEGPRPVPRRRLAVADTMDLWIRTEPDELRQLLQRIDGLVLNDSEAKLLTGEENLVRAGHAVRAMGPAFVVIKKGEHGAMFFSQHETYVLPAYPTPTVVDPTGAGDSFAGGMMGYLAEQGNFEPKTLKEAMAYGILVASFTVEDFSLDKLASISREDLDQRMDEYRRMLSF